MFEKVKVSAVKSSDYELESLIAAVREAVLKAGGLPEHINSHSKILLKPNLLTAKSPSESPTVTHPEFIRAVIRVLKEKGIYDITIGDSPAGVHKWEDLWEKTGIAEVAKSENVKLIPFENLKFVYLDSLRIPVLKELDNFDAVISLPKLKTHLLTKTTGSVKNSYGLIIGHAKGHFHTLFPSPMKMSKFIGRLYAAHFKFDFSIMDAVECMQGDGPNAGYFYHAGIIFASSDAVALDSAASEIFGYLGENIPLLKSAEKYGGGVCESSKIERCGDGWDVVSNSNGKKSKAEILFKFPDRIFFIVSLITRTRPKVEHSNCTLCRICEKACAQKAIYIKNKKVKLKSSKCILCMCCIEACPKQTIKLRTSRLWTS